MGSKTMYLTAAGQEDVGPNVDNFVRCPRSRLTLCHRNLFFL